MNERMSGAVLPALWPAPRPALWRALWRGMPAALLCCATLWAATAHAQIGPERADQLMRASGMWEQLPPLGVQLRKSVQDGLKAPGAEALAAREAQILAAADAAFTPERLRASAQRVVAQSVRTVHLPALTAWYQAPLGQRLTKAEIDNALSARNNDDKAREGSALLQAAGPERRRLLNKIVEDTRAGSTNADLLVAMLVSMKNAMAPFNDKPAPPDQEVQAALQAQRPQMVAALDNLALVSLAVTYKDVSDDDLAAYSAFIGSAAGDHFVDISQRAFEAALVEAFAAMGKPKG